MQFKVRTAVLFASTALLAAGTTALAAGTASAAQPDTVHPLSARKCGSVYCVQVIGTKLHVNDEVVTRKDNGHLNGYVYAQDDDDSYFGWSPKTTAYSMDLIINKSFSNNSSFCGGVAPSQTPEDYGNSVCFTIHN